MNTSSAHDTLWQRMRRHLTWLFTPPHATNWQPSKALGIQPMAMPERPGLPPWAGRSLLEITPVRMPAVPTSQPKQPSTSRKPLGARKRALIAAYCREHGIPLPWEQQPKRLPPGKLRDIYKGTVADISTVPMPPDTDERDPSLVTVGDVAVTTPPQHNPLALTGAFADLLRPPENAWLNSPRTGMLAGPEIAQEIRAALFNIEPEECAPEQKDPDATEKSQALLKLRYCEHKPGSE